MITRRIVPLGAVAPIRPAPDPCGPRPQLLTALADHYGPLTTSIYTRSVAPTRDQWQDLGITTSTPATETVYLTRTTAPEPRALTADVHLTCAPMRIAYPASHWPPR